MFSFKSTIKTKNTVKTAATESSASVHVYGVFQNGGNVARRNNGMGRTKTRVVKSIV